jgi:hypothetical protein
MCVCVCARARACVRACGRARVCADMSTSYCLAFSLDEEAVLVGSRNPKCAPPLVELHAQARKQARAHTHAAHAMCPCTSILAHARMRSPTRPHTHLHKGGPVARQTSLCLADTTALSRTLSIFLALSSGVAASPIPKMKRRRKRQKRGADHLVKGPIGVHGHDAVGGDAMRGHYVLLDRLQHANLVRRRCLRGKAHESSEGVGQLWAGWKLRQPYLAFPLPWNGLELHTVWLII